jgi:hypothetical protein
VVATVLGVFAPVAWGAFPGRDGDLVVATASGLELVSPATGAARPICTEVVLCGDPEQPVFSPNGRAIAFVDARSGRLVVVGADGSCLWCLIGPPLTAAAGIAPAFMPGGQRVSLAGDGVWAVSLTGPGVTRLGSGSVDAAVWSASGVAAVVRHGFVWVGRPGQGPLRRVLHGGSPSWSPDGTRLAFTRGGYVWVVRAAGAQRPQPPATSTSLPRVLTATPICVLARLSCVRTAGSARQVVSARQLVQGGGPAWSPDGSQIAFIAPGGAVKIISAGGGAAHEVGSVQGTALDWQPEAPRAQPVCQPPAGATVLASDSQAVVYSPHDTVIDGCLNALGRPQLLLNARNAEPWFSGVFAVRLAGRFALLETTYQDQHSNGLAKLTLSDLSTGKARNVQLGAFGAGGGPGPTVEGFDSLALDSSGFAAWRQTTMPTPAGIAALSCQSASLCIGADTASNILISTNPTRGPMAWTIAPVFSAGTSSEGISGVSCPSASLCVAVDTAGTVLASTDPAGGPTAWTTVASDPGTQFTAISCPSVSLCVAAGGQTILTSTDPAPGGSAWISTPLASGTVGSLSCPSVSLCVATNNPGRVMTSTDPTGGVKAWKYTSIPTETNDLNPVSAVSCPSASLCVVAGGANGAVFTSTDPASGASSWTRAAIPGDLTGVSCPSVSLCVGSDISGHVFTSTNPAGGASAWTTAGLYPNIPSAATVAQVSCPSITLCVAIGPNGSFLTSTDPAGGANTWTSETVDVPGCPQTLAPCATEQLFVHDDQGTRVIDTAPRGPIDSLSNITLAGDLPTLNWTHDGARQQLPLR